MQLYDKKWSTGSKVVVNHPLTRPDGTVILNSYGNLYDEIVDVNLVGLFGLDTERRVDRRYARLFNTKQRKESNLDVIGTVRLWDSQGGGDWKDGTALMLSITVSISMSGIHLTAEDETFSISIRPCLFCSMCPCG